MSLVERLKKELEYEYLNDPTVNHVLKLMEYDDTVDPVDALILCIRHLVKCREEAVDYATKIAQLSTVPIIIPKEPDSGGHSDNGRTG